MAAEGLDGLVEQGVDGCHVLHGGVVAASVVVGICLGEVGSELVESVDVFGWSFGQAGRVLAERGELREVIADGAYVGILPTAIALDD